MKNHFGCAKRQGGYPADYHPAKSYSMEHMEHGPKVKIPGRMLLSSLRGAEWAERRWRRGNSASDLSKL